MKFEELRNKYDTFIFDSFDIDKSDDTYKVTFHFEIVNLSKFDPTIEFKSKKNIDDFSKYLIFHAGLIELISYWKIACPKNVIIKAGYLNKKQIAWFKKLYFYGLGEMFYVNDIKTNIDDFMNITCTKKKTKINIPVYNGIGNLIPIGGGKDSCVTLEILKEENNNSCFVINPKEVSYECIKAAKLSNDTLIINRTLDKEMLKLNKEGFLNGHTPFSSLVAFFSYLIAYLNDKKYIILSNEASANEPTIPGTKINHQYSKTYEFEKDFNEYTKKYFNIDIKYFSLLRCLNESQIAMLFARYEKYHKIFKSCNVGSKEKPWIWCGKCPKCLFVYIILSPFLYKDKLINIFGCDLYKNEDLIDTLLELTGNKDIKPFECVGTIKEVNYSLSLTIKKLEQENEKLPPLLKYYKENFDLVDLEDSIYDEFNNINNINDYFIDLVVNALNKK